MWQLILINRADYIKVVNNYDDALINYVIVIFRQSFNPAFSYQNFPLLDRNKNEMQEVVNHHPVKMAIGKFEMRRDTTWLTGGSDKCSFCGASGVV